MAWLIWDSKTEVPDLKMLRYSRLSKDKRVNELTQPDLLNSPIVPCCVLQVMQTHQLPILLQGVGRKWPHTCRFRVFFNLPFSSLQQHLPASGFLVCLTLSTASQQSTQCVQNCIHNLLLLPGGCLPVTFVCPGLGLWAWLWPTVVKTQLCSQEGPAKRAMVSEYTQFKLCPPTEGGVLPLLPLLPSVRTALLWMPGRNVCGYTNVQVYMHRGIKSPMSGEWRL